MSDSTSMPDTLLSQETALIANRFRGFLPVVVDFETGGFNAGTDAVLEVAAVLVNMNAAGALSPGETIAFNVQPFPGLKLEPASLKVTGIDPFDTSRNAIDEDSALRELFRPIRRAVKDNDCNRAILVGHNAFFDLGFLNAAVARNDIKRNPFHPFSTFDTATLAGVAFGQTVLSRAVLAAGFDWDDTRAHSAVYDAEMTAKLFCETVNRSRDIYETRDRRVENGDV